MAIGENLYMNSHVDWENLPKHLLDSIVLRLMVASDYLQFSMVCTSWRSVAKDNKAKWARMRTPPMLLIHGGRKDRNNTGRKDTWNLYNVMSNKVLDLQVSVSNYRYCGSSKGWLIAVDDDNIVSLINPFYRVRGRKKKKNSIIVLPPLELNSRGVWNARGNYQVFKATISADPVLDASDCIVTVIYEPFERLAFLNLSKDTKWTYIDESVTACKRWLYIREVAQVEDEFYAVNRSNQVLSLDTTAEWSSNEGSFAYYGIKQKRIERKQYLVDLNGEGCLLLVERYIEYDEEDVFSLKRKTFGFKFFDFNFEKGQWIEKHTLGDLALFLGDNSSISLVASNFPGCRSNCVYFNHDADLRSIIPQRSWRPDDFGVYDLGSRCLSQPYTTHAMTLIKTSKQPPIWIHPTIFL